MSRPDAHDMEYAYMRNGATPDRDGLNSFAPPAMGPYPGQDRRQSNATMPSSFSLYGPSAGPRGGGMSEWEQQDLQTPLTGKPTHHSFSSFQRPPPPPLSSPHFYGPAPVYGGGDSMYRQQLNSPSAIAHSPTTPNNPVHMTRSTLWWGDLEPWMDEEYAKQVCKLMGWNPISIKVPHPPPDPSSGQQPNNPGYCFLAFQSPAEVQAVLNQVSGSQATMPNSSKPFTLNWASSAPSMTHQNPASLPPPQQQHTPEPHHRVDPQGQQQQTFIKEYSIFVGDLAPETSNSDLVAVFRNPVLGLRNDREPKFIRPFLSCKSAKIMLDPVTGVSRGYGFVRFVYYPYLSPS